MKRYLWPVHLTTLALLMSLAASVHGAGSSPGQLLRQLGRFTISDGASYYTFAKDGAFASGPLGMSGRTLSGTWTSDRKSTPFKVTVLAKTGWLNGISGEGDFRRLVFIIYDLSSTPVRKQTQMVHEGYYLIDELTHVPASTPATPPGKQAARCPFVTCFDQCCSKGQVCAHTGSEHSKCLTPPSHRGAGR